MITNVEGVRLTGFHKKGNEELHRCAPSTIDLALPDFHRHTNPIAVDYFFVLYHCAGGMSRKIAHDGQPAVLRTCWYAGLRSLLLLPLHSGSCPGSSVSDSLVPDSDVAGNALLVNGADKLHSSLRAHATVPRDTQKRRFDPWGLLGSQERFLPRYVAPSCREPDITFVAEPRLRSAGRSV